MRLSIPIILTLALAVVAPCWAEDSSVNLPDLCKRATLHSSVVVPAGQTSALSASWPVAFARTHGLQVTVASSGTPALAILVTGTMDGATWGGPTAGQTATTLTADGTWLVTLTLPPLEEIKVAIANASPTTNSTVTIKGVARP